MRMKIMLQIEDFTLDINKIVGTHSCAEQHGHDNVCSKNCSGQRVGPVTKLPPWNTSQVQSKQDVFNEAKVHNRNVQNWQTSCAEIASTTTQVVVQYSPTKGASKSHMTAEKVLGTLSRLPGMSGEANDAVSADTQVKMSDGFRLLELLDPKHWDIIDDPMVPQERNLHGHP